MLDPKLLREDLAQVAQKLKNRGFTVDVDVFQALEARRKNLQSLTQDLQAERNTLSKLIGMAKAKGENADEALQKVNLVSEKLTEAEKNLAELQEELLPILMRIPNIPHDSVPIGRSEKENIEIRRSGTPRAFNFTPLDHISLGEKLQGINFDKAAKLSGARFVTLFGAIARLQRALGQFMLDMHTKNHGYTEVYVPFMVLPHCLEGTGQLPNLQDDLFHIDDERNFYLIPTAEVPVTNLVREETLDAALLPLKFVCHTPCFRKEAGSYGKDTKGMIRQHQFEKVELVQICRPEDSAENLEKLIGHAEAILQALELPYRVLALCTGDLGFASSKTYDLEVWLPAQNTYREISSCSNMTDFQARRMQTRFKDSSLKKNELVHTLNGSGLAIGRTLIAILENYQTEDGDVVIPTALRSYLDGKETLKNL